MGATFAVSEIDRPKRRQAPQLAQGHDQEQHAQAADATQVMSRWRESRRAIEVTLPR